MKSCIISVMMVSLMIKSSLSTNYDLTSNYGCLPANECISTKSSTIGMTSKQYICQDDNSVCEATYANGECSGDYLLCNSV